MQDSITPEALEALSKKATQAAEDVRTKKTIDAMHAAFVAESAFARAVAALYRTGQLILAQPSEPWGYGWYENGGKKMATGYLPTIDYPRSEYVSEGPFPLYRHQPAQPSGDEVVRGK